MGVKLCNDYEHAIGLLRKQSDKKSVEVANRLEKVLHWTYPDLSTEDIVKVIRCKDCMYYKKYRKKSPYKSVAFYACSLTKTKREPTFFCKDGEYLGNEKYKCKVRENRK